MSLREKARKITVLSEIMDGRTKIATRDIVGEPLTIVDFDIVADARKPYAVIVFAEYPENFCFGGQVLTSLLADLISDYGDKDAVVAAMAEEGGLKIRLTTETAKTKNAETGLYNTYTAVQVL